MPGDDELKHDPSWRMLDAERKLRRRFSPPQGPLGRVRRLWAAVSAGLDWLRIHTHVLAGVPMYIIVMSIFLTLQLYVYPNRTIELEEEVVLDLDLPIATDPEQAPDVTLRQGKRVTVEACGWIAEELALPCGVSIPTGDYWVRVRSDKHTGEAWCDGVRKVTAPCVLCRKALAHDGD